MLKMFIGCSSNKNLEIFDNNPTIKACLHKSRRYKVATKIHDKTLDLNDIRALIHTYNKDGCLSSLVIAMATVSCCRIATITNKKFHVDVASKGILVHFGTKTSKHAIILPTKLKIHFDRLKKAKLPTYKKILEFTKTKFQTGTHICRRSGTAILLEKFSMEEIALFGHWATKSTVGKHYAKSKILQRISDFYEAKWERQITE